MVGSISVDVGAIEDMPASMGPACEVKSRTAARKLSAWVDTWFA